MKKIILSTLCISSLLQAASYKSTQEAISSIFNSYNSLLQTSNIFNASTSFKEITKLNSSLNQYIMSKQGILLGKTSPRKGIFRKPSGEADNIFDLWELAVYPLYSTDLTNTLKTIRITKGSDKKTMDLLNTWNTNGSAQNLIERAQEIRSNSILGQKKELADLIIFFIEQNRELIQKAVQDSKSLQ
jgi:curved DNA-binding protein CbpA